MDKKKVVPTWVSVLLVILAVTTMVFCIAGLLGGNLPTVAVIATVTDCLLGILALIYCFTGYKKSSAKFFRIFCILFVLDKTIAFYARNNFSSQYTLTMFADVYNTTLSLIAFGAMCILAFGNDLGRTKSFCLSGLVLASTVGVFAYLTTCFAISSILSWVINIINAIILVIMVYAKYQDKAARGTK